MYKRQILCRRLLYDTDGTTAVQSQPPPRAKEAAECVPECRVCVKTRHTHTTTTVTVGPSRPTRSRYTTGDSVCIVVENQDDGGEGAKSQKLQGLQEGPVFFFFFCDVLFPGHKPQKSLKNASSEAEEEKVFRPPQLELSKLQT